MKTIQPVKIAIADDHLIFRKGVCALIDSYDDCKVIIDAADGQELIDRIKESAYLPDVCMLDIDMPGLNGYETLLRLKALWPDIPVLVLTIFKAEYAILRMIKDGAMGYLTKNCSPRELRDAIMTLHNKGAYYTDLPVKIDLRQGKSDSRKNLTDKEKTFLLHCCSDLSYKDIARQMGVSPNTVDGYHAQLSEKLGIKNRIGFAIFALKAGLVSLEK